MLKAIIDILFLISSLGLIIGLKKQSDPSTARQGNLLAAYSLIFGIVLAFIYPLNDGPIFTINFLWIIVSLAIGTFIGLYFAKKVEMTGMPQLVSLFNGLGGLSAVLIGYVELLNLDTNHPSFITQVSSTIFAVVIGAIAFSGSLLAYLKLDGKLNDNQVTFRGHNILNYSFISKFL